MTTEIRMDQIHDPETEHGPEAEHDTQMEGDEEFVAVPSFAQQRLWVMEQMEDGAPTYNIQVGLRMRGVLELGVLQRVLDEIVRRHETLRTRLMMEDGQLVQLIAAEATIPLRLTDLAAQAASHTPHPDAFEPAADAAWQAVAERELRVPFDTASELPVRAAVLRLADDDHVLLITLDHLICDAWSLRVLHTELVTLYPAFVSGAVSPLPELPVQYADYAVWQRQWLDGAGGSAQLDHWRSTLGDNPPRLAFHSTGGASRNEPGSPSSSSSTHPLSDSLVRRLEELARGEGASLFSALLSTFGVLLSKYGRQEEFVVGSLLAGRSRPELEDLIGFFVNTVGLRMDLTGSPTFRELLARVHDVALDAYAHQDVPFERVAEELNPDYEPGRDQPFFDVMFQLADLSRESAAACGLSLEPLPMASEPAPVALVVAVLKEGGGHQCVWDYRTELFGAAEIRRMQRQFVSLLESAVADPDRPVAELDWTHEDRTGGPACADEEVAPDEQWTFHRHFDAMVRRFPGETALVDGEQRLTYAELDRLANRLAHVLITRGVAPDVVVGIFQERGIDQVVSILAVVKAGGAYLPLDPSYPHDRIRYMIEDSAPPLVITARGVAGLPARSGTEAVDIEDLADSAATALDSAPAITTLPDHLAYVIYTSGSTGRPKGTGVPHRGLRIVLRALDEVLGLDHRDRVLHFASASFDASVLEMLMAFGAGAALHIAPSENGIPVDLTRFLQDEAITALLLTPSALAAVVEDAPLPALRTITVGGEACPPALAARWARDRRFFNLFGPTEATIVSTWHRVTTADGGAVPIGLPMPGLAVHILDDAHRPVPVGVPGELYVAGQVVVRGYLGRPALTAERFVPDPFATTPGRRLYRTGDLVRRNEQGTIDFLGRIDDQVKIRGFRIELGEIENTLAAHRAVREAVAVVREDMPGAKELVGYVVAAPGAPLDPLEVRELCASRLPHYMVPSHLVVLDRLPTTGAGKIDRRALPAPERGSRAAEPDDTPAGPLETAIADVWSEVLGIAGITRADDFFDLGGNSLSATQVIIRMRQEFGLELSVRTLFDSAELGEFVDAVREAAMAQED